MLERLKSSNQHCLIKGCFPPLEMESSSSSGSSKRAKGFENTRHVVSCLVDECNSDLSQCREYHRRHKVCEFHSKWPKVTIGGREQRFCQQCSRFHSLGEFDDGKRSCRKRLDSHNRRRRKPPSESPSISSGRFIPNQQGTTLLSFNTTQQLLPTAMVDSSWAGQSNANGPYYCHDEPITNISRTHSFGEQNQFKIMSNKDYHVSEPHFPKPILNHGTVSGNSNMYDTTRVVDSDCALSLLSSSTTAENRGIGLGYNSIVPNMQYCEEPMSSSSYNTHHNSLHCQGLFQNGPDGPTNNGPNPTLSFKWE